jgi:hypothetical protein
MRIWRRTAAGLCVLGWAAAPAGAQQPEQLPIAVVDVRGFYSKLGQDPVTAADLGVAATDLPARGPGGVAGIHLYPLRFRNMAIGIGAEGVLARAHHDIEPEEDDEVLEGTPSLLTRPVDQRIRGLSFSVSLNFGHRDGWSYLSAGAGPLSFVTYLGGTRPAETPPVMSTLNFGAGARWFPKSHVAFCFDIRFYQTRPQVETASYPSRQRANLLIMSAGVSFT